MLEERELGRESMYAVACDCNTTAMGPCCTVMRSQYHGLWVYTWVYVWCKEHQNGLTRVCTCVYG